MSDSTALTLLRAEIEMRDHHLRVRQEIDRLMFRFHAHGRFTSTEKAAYAELRRADNALEVFGAELSSEGAAGAT